MHFPESEKRANERIEQNGSKAKAALVTRIIFFDPHKSGLQERLLNLVNHDERIKLQKLIMWAMNNCVELRIQRIED